MLKYLGSHESDTSDALGFSTTGKAPDIIWVSFRLSWKCWLGLTCSTSVLTYGGAVSATRDSSAMAAWRRLCTEARIRKVFVRAEHL
jgi:hypothetical protein